MQANLPSVLHVPHVGVQSTGIVSGLAQISGVLLHPVRPGQVLFVPVGSPSKNQVISIQENNGDDKCHQKGLRKE